MESVQAIPGHSEQAAVAGGVGVQGQFDLPLRMDNFFELVGMPVALLPDELSAQRLGPDGRRSGRDRSAQNCSTREFIHGPVSSDCYWLRLRRSYVRE